MKPWTWDELRKIRLDIRLDREWNVVDDAKGRRYRAFLERYGLRGALALDLSLDIDPPRGMSIGRRDVYFHCAPRDGGFVDCRGEKGCPRDGIGCCPWHSRSRAAMMEWYSLEIQKHGRGAEGER